MRFPSFEKPEKNPFLVDAEPTDTALNEPVKKEAEKQNKKPEEKEKKRAEEVPKKKEEKKEKEQKDTKKADEKKKPDQETLEIKKAKRQHLVERSLHYKKTYEEIPVPRNPWTIARLMVADHLLSLYAQIHKADARPDLSKESELLASFDYMGVIADKLENPELESTPEVEETCEILIQLAEETLQEDDPNTAKVLIEANVQSAQLPFGEALPKEKDVAPLATPNLSSSGAALVAILLHARRSAPPPNINEAPAVNDGQPIIQPSAEGDSVATPTPLAIKTPENRRPISHIPQRPQPTSHVASLSRTLETSSQIDQAPYRNETAPTPSRAPEALAGLAVATVLLHNSEPKKPSFVNEPHPTTPRVRHDTIALPIAKAPHPEVTPSRPYVALPLTSPETIPHAELRKPVILHQPEHTLHSESHPSSREIEHLPLHSLLSMAENISIGHGQRLRSAFEKGAIDKEGLVKVLKSHGKHHDFLQEYKRQAIRRHNLIQSSPEFLTSSHTKDTAASEDARPHSHSASQADTTPVTTPRSEAVSSWPAFPNPVKNTPDTDPFNLHEQPTTRSAWFGITILGLLAAGIFLLVVIYLIFQ